MTIHDELTVELKAAMRERDKPRINVIRQIETEVSLAKSAPGFSGEADDELYLEIIESYVKKMDKARLEYAAAGARGQGNADKQPDEQAGAEPGTDEMQGLPTDPNVIAPPGTNAWADGGPGVTGPAWRRRLRFSHPRPLLPGCPRRLARSCPDPAR